MVGDMSSRGAASCGVGPEFPGTRGFGEPRAFSRPRHPLRQVCPPCPRSWRPVQIRSFISRYETPPLPSSIHLTLSLSHRYCGQAVSLGKLPSWAAQCRGTGRGQAGRDTAELLARPETGRADIRHFLPDPSARPISPRDRQPARSRGQAVTCRLTAGCVGLRCPDEGAASRWRRTPVFCPLSSPLDRLAPWQPREGSSAALSKVSQR